VTKRISLPHEWEPRRYQRRVMRYLDHGGKRAMCVWHRRAGKDLTFLHQTAKLAHERRGVYWHCLPTYSQAKKAVWDGFTRDGRRIIDSVFPPALVAKKNESEMLVELRCGSIIQLVGSDSIDRLVGAGPVGVTFSEYALAKPGCWDLVRPMLAENGGWAAFITTPRGNNHAKKLFDVAQRLPDWFSERLTIHDTGALPAAIIEEERKAGMEEALIRQEYLCDFTAALVGSIWGDLVEQLEKEGGLEAFEHERDGVFTSWDLGISDSTAIWFWRLVDGGVDFIDHYEAHGKPLSHFFDEVEVKGYRYIKHWLPHDARARTLASGTSILEQCVGRWGNSLVAIGPSLSLLDGMQAARWMLQQKVRIHSRCADGIEALKDYHYEWDEDARTFRKKPAHTWSSHSADAFRYAATVVRAADVLTRKPERKPERPSAVPMDKSFTLDELFRANESAHRARRIA
jgi:phage terminase large subunit